MSGKQSIESMMRRVEMIPECGCWIWMGKAQRNGGYEEYGKAWMGGKEQRAHRVMWMLTNGPIPDGMLVCHECDVRLCINPAHLFLGTDRDNQLDSIRKGRARPPVNVGHEYRIKAHVVAD